MDRICFWNVRGFNYFRKQKDVLEILKKNKIGLYGFVEIKLNGKNIGNVISNMFGRIF